MAHSSVELSLEKTIADRAKERFGEKVAVVYVKPKRVKVTTAKEEIRDVAAFVKKELGFDHVASVTAVDYPKEKKFEVVYHLGSIAKQELRKVVLAVSTKLDRDEAVTPSLIDVWSGCEYHERETFEMFGIRFEGHPQLQRFILPEDWDDIPPLRKDYNLPGRTE